MIQNYGNLSKLKEQMAALGVKRLIVKRLSENDNSKNQIYLGSNFDALNILPFGDIYEDHSEKHQILKASLDFRWLQADGSLSVAPNAQLILYPQYPEIRMSSVLKGSKGAPSDLIANREAGRLLFLGIDDHGTIIAAVVPSNSALAREFAAATANEDARLFYELPLSGSSGNTKGRLLSELRRIHEAGWINSKRLLADGSVGTCTSQHCGGYTLEAELGVKPNGFSEPDYLGWEVKQHGVSNFAKPSSGGAITLMTPEPTGGYYKQDGAEAFVRKYGYPDKGGQEDRINFGGTYRVGKMVALTRLTILLDGYDAATGELHDATKGITLLDEKGNAAAIWSYAGIMKHWARKHERAVYVASEKRMEDQRQYRYSNLVLLGEKTDFFLFLKAMSNGYVYYDPAIKIENASKAHPKLKRRSQFRVRFKDVPPLYTSANWVDVTKPD